MRVGGLMSVVLYNNSRLSLRSVGAGPQWSDTGSGDRQWPVRPCAGRSMEGEEGGGENDQRGVHVGIRTAGGGQSHDVKFRAHSRRVLLDDRPSAAHFCSLTGSCHTRSWFSSTACAASVLPPVWCSSSWRTAVSPTTCEPGKAVCLRTRCGACVRTSARVWPTWRAPTSSTEIW